MSRRSYFQQPATAWRSMNLGSVSVGACTSHCGHQERHRINSAAVHQKSLTLCLGSSEPSWDWEGVLYHVICRLCAVLRSHEILPLSSNFCILRDPFVVIHSFSFFLTKFLILNVQMMLLLKLVKCVLVAPLVYSFTVVVSSHCDCFHSPVAGSRDVKTFLGSEGC